MTLLSALNKLRPYDKAKYFLWKHKMRNTKTDFSKFSKKQFIEKYLNGREDRFAYLQLWETSEEYSEIANLMLAERVPNDLIEIYNTVREKALAGEDKAVRTFLTLSKELEQRLKRLEEAKVQEKEEQEEEEELILDL